VKFFRPTLKPNSDYQALKQYRIAAGCTTEKPTVLFSTDVTRVSLLQNDHTGSETHPTPRAIEWGYNLLWG
jgi:hypothetical protein